MNMDISISEIYFFFIYFKHSLPGQHIIYFPLMAGPLPTRAPILLMARPLFLSFFATSIKTLGVSGYLESFCFNLDVLRETLHLTPVNFTKPYRSV